MTAAPRQPILRPNMGCEFQREATWARGRAELATGVHRDLMIAVAEAYELLAKLEEMLADPQPAHKIIALQIIPAEIGPSQTATPHATN
jgi:hypothetical protein